jgi:hypothetical protein
MNWSELTLSFVFAGLSGQRTSLRRATLDESVASSTASGSADPSERAAHEPDVVGAE